MGMHFTAENQYFTNILALQPPENFFGCGNSQPRTFTWLGAKVAVATAIKTLIGRHNGVSRTIGNCSEIIYWHKIKKSEAFTYAAIVVLISRNTTACLIP
jgi:hypothetical protein